MTRHLDWAQDGKDWPNREASRFVNAAGICWHVQVMGQGPVLLLVHGTGASSHSWRDLIPLLATQFSVVAPDLPAHGFTQAPAPSRMSLPGMALALSSLLAEIGMRPDIAVGHSAGAAILARMCLDGRIAPRVLISINGALLPLHAMPEELFGPLARGLMSISFVPRVFAWQARSPQALQRLVDSTGSRLDARGIALYRKLASNPGHVAGALAMMAHWSLRPLQHDLPRLQVPLTLIVGDRDRTVPPQEARRVATLLPSARVISRPGLGHLAHEEDPLTFARLILEAAA